MRKTYELEDWEWRLILCVRRLIREKFQGQIHVDLVLKAIVGQFDTRVQRLDPSPPVSADGARV